MPKIKPLNKLKTAEDISRKFTDEINRNHIKGFCLMDVDGLGVAISGNYSDVDNFTQLLAKAVACAADEFQISPALLLSRTGYHLSNIEAPIVQSDPLLDALKETFGKLFEGGEET